MKMNCQWILEVSIISYLITGVHGWMNTLDPHYDPAAATLSFDGTQYVLISMPDESQTETEDVMLRFRTKRPSGLLFATTSERTKDRMELRIDNSRVCLEIDLGSGKKAICVGNHVNNDKWHTIKILRKARSIKLQLDGENRRETMSGDARILEAKNINIGKVKKDPRGKKYTTFLGYMQQFVFNGNQFFELAKDGKIKNIEMTAKFGNTGKLVQMPITFKSATAYVKLSQINIYATFSLYFQFKTTQPNGLLFYNAGKGYDFIAIEIVSGILHYVFNTGSGTNLVTSANTHRSPLNDNQWHDVAILRPSLSKQILRLDGQSSTFTTANDLSAVHFDLSGPLFVGGAPKSMFNALPKMVASKQGFQGCLASLDFTGITPDLIQDSVIPREFHQLIAEGCNGPTTQCSPSACDNNGRCVQQWNSFTCDCDMTSYTGPTCSDESIAYKFGNRGGLIMLNFPQSQRPDTKRDQLALGFITEDKDAVLTRIDSGSSEDFIQMEIVSGEIFVTYNMGTNDHPIGEFFTKVDDGKYHVIRFTRSGPNATIQVDNLPVQTKHPTGRQLNIFNDQAKVHIGGLKPKRIGRSARNPQISRPFTGTIAGLVLNGLRILDLAAKKDPRVVIEGEVELQMALPGVWSTNVTPLTPTKPVIATPDPSRDSSATVGMQSTMGLHKEDTSTGYFSQTTPKQDGGTDDIIFSGAGSGCHGDDEDECDPGLPGDNIITPIVKIHTTPAPPTTISTTTNATILQTTTLVKGFGSGLGPCDDEEDCEESGSGEVPIDTSPQGTTDDIYISKSKTTTEPPAQNGTGFISTINMTETPPRKNPINGIVEEDNSKNPNRHELNMPVTTEKTITPTAGDPNAGETTGSMLSKIFTLPVIIGIAVGSLVILLIIIYVFYKCKGRDEGSYKIDESKNYRIEAKPLKSDAHINGGLKAGVAPTKPSKKKDIKEWYV
ncbi:neurexin-3-like [Tubulanus polymorphus]|uniref:neurexin-3-like n=1 Tax=Tubulanus polymorphus TaxID=672921 RepID=UPI003DA3D819